MERKIILLSLSILIIFLGLQFFKSKVGDIRPVVLPPSKQVEKKPQENQNIPMQINDQRVSVYASNLGSARDLEFSPGGTLLLSIPASGKIISLPDKKVILSGLNKPHGLSFRSGKLFIAEEAKVVRYNWDENNLSATQDKVLFSLPSGGRHFTRTIAFNKEGQMFISVGSTCDVCVEKDPRNGSVMVSDADGGNPRIFAKGLRNAVFIAVNPETNELWGTEMGRDFLGDAEPPDEINIIREGKDYGWPFCFGNKIKDTSFSGSKATPCEATEAPIYEIAAHSAPLGLAFHRGYLYISYHGSWNRSTPIGYKVVRFKVEGNTIKDEQDFITGFLNGSEASARPVDIIFDKEGDMFLSDDKAGVVYKVNLR